MNKIINLIYFLVSILIFAIIWRNKETVKQFLLNIITPTNKREIINSSGGFGEQTIEDIAIKLNGFLNNPFWKDDDEESAIKWINSISRPETWQKLKLKYAMLYNKSLLSDLKKQLETDEFLKLKWRN